MYFNGITVVGAGLAGSEAAWQIAQRGVKVRLFEMRPKVMTKAHKTGSCAELVCSNSLRGNDLSNAVGLLKEELKIMDSLIMESAITSQVPAGGALAVDRELFSAYINKRIKEHPYIEFYTDEIESIPEHNEHSPLIIATGPLTSEKLANNIRKIFGHNGFAFFDAISPIIIGDSIDMTKIFRQSRYDKGGDDYLNIPMSEEQYQTFVNAIIEAEKYGGHEEVESDYVADLKPFEGCMPIEEMAIRGRETLRFGPMKPVGLTDPNTNQQPAAVIQLRQDNKEATLWNMVGFQTRLKQGEQLRIFKTLSGLENAEFVRLGSVHRNSFINSPQYLNSSLQYKDDKGLFFAGQITGVEGYVESTAGGIVAGINAYKIFSGKEPLVFPSNTAIGALMKYISDPSRKDFQPMNISYGLLPSYHDKSKRRASKKEKRIFLAEAALSTLRSLKENKVFI